jgi:hypothetical protein
MMRVAEEDVMRQIRVVMVLGALVLLLTIPASEPASEPSSEPSSAPPWAQEAVDWIEARNEAAALGVANLLRFMAPDVVYYDASAGPPLIGRAQYGAALQSDELVTDDELRTDLVYLDVGGAIVASAGAFGTVVTLDVGADGRTTAEATTDPAGGYLADRRPAVAARAVALAYVAAWSGADPPAVS